MKTGFHGPDREAERLRRLGQRKADIEAEDDDRPPFGRKTPQAFVDGLPVGDLARLIVDRGDIERRDLDLDRAAPPTPNEVQARMNDQAMQPRVEAIRVAQSRKVAPCTDQRFLGRVACKLAIPKDQLGDATESREDNGRERGKGVVIAFGCAFDESTLVHESPRSPVRAQMRSQGYGTSVEPTVPRPADGGAQDGDGYSIIVDVAGLETRSYRIEFSLT